MSKPTRITHGAQWIDCVSDAYAHHAYLAMFYYAFGQLCPETDWYIDLVKANASRLSTATLYALDSALREKASLFTRLASHPRAVYHIYGSPGDRRQWLKFHEWVNAQLIEKRKK